MKYWRRVSVGVLLMCTVAACTLPRGAPLRSEIVNGADQANAEYAHYEVDRSLLPRIKAWPKGTTSTRPQSWPSNTSRGTGQIITAGDLLQIGVWESGDNKLLTTQGAPSTDLKATRVSPSGNVFVPYIGAVKVSGLSPDAAREKIQTKATELIPSAQVQLAATPGAMNSVDLVSGVASPGQFPLEDQSLTILGLISRGGGVSSAVTNPQLRLFRGGRSYDISMQSLLDNPARDITVKAGDKLIVQKDDRSFFAFGATGSQKVVPFPKDDITAIEAITMLGGLDANRANPKGLMILRQYPANAVHADGNGGPKNERVVFSMNLTTTDGLFSAQNFPVQAGDLVVGTESPFVTARTIMSLFNSSATTVNNVN